MSRLYKIDGFFGGSDIYDENGNLVGFSVPGIIDGEDFYWNDGRTGFTVDSIFDTGQNYYGSDGTIVYSDNSIFGGQIIHGDISGYSIDSPFGGSDIYLEGDE